MMIRAAAGALALLMSAPSHARELRALDYTLPADKPVSIVLMRPDVEAGAVSMGGVGEPNADWTRTVRGNLQSALADSLKARRIELRTFPEIAGADVQLIADYEALHWAVARSMIDWMYGPDLPSKQYKDGVKLPKNQVAASWTLGPQIAQISQLSGANYALFLYSRHYFASSRRKAMQVAGILGCVVGFCAPTGGGEHFALVSLVDLKTGDVVWIRTSGAYKGDVREDAGARAMVDALIERMPTRPGESFKL